MCYNRNVDTPELRLLVTRDSRITLHWSLYRNVYDSFVMNEGLVYVVLPQVLLVSVLLQRNRPAGRPGVNRCQPVRRPQVAQAPDKAPLCIRM